MKMLNAALIMSGLFGSFFSTKALAHGVVFPNSAHFALKSTNKALANYPASGSSRAFAASIKTLTGATIKNTVLSAPLNNVSGKFSGTYYYSSVAADNGVFESNVVFSAYFPFGNSSFNNGAHMVTTYVGNVSNYISTGLHPVASINLFHSDHVSGAQGVLQGFYDKAAANGYNQGIQSLQHPTGGLLFGTTYFGEGSLTTYDQSFPAFLALGNNAYNSSSAAMRAFAGNLTISPLPISYLQFGKIIRPITNGNLFSTTYYPLSSLSPNPPFGPAPPGIYFANGYFGLTIGSNPLNTLLYRFIEEIPIHSRVTFF